jgi:hypothetical protein
MQLTLSDMNGCRVRFTLTTQCDVQQVFTSSVKVTIQCAERVSDELLKWAEVTAQVETLKGAIQCFEQVQTELTCCQICESSSDMVRTSSWGLLSFVFTIY